MDNQVVIDTTKFYHQLKTVAQIIERCDGDPAETFDHFISSIILAVGNMEMLNNANHELNTTAGGYRFYIKIMMEDVSTDGDKISMSAVIDTIRVRSTYHTDESYLTSKINEALGISTEEVK